MSVNSTIKVFGENDYVLEGGRLTFFIEDAWTDQNVEVVAVSNYKNYNPRVYHGHAKFSGVGKHFSGDVDFLVPHAALLSAGAKTFTGVFILSWVEDHWGSTVSVDCTLEPM